MSSDSKRQLPPFLDSHLDNHDIYQKLPYKKDINLCPPEMIKLVTGNVIKYYAVVPDEEIILDTNELAYHLVALGKEDSRRYHSHIIANPEDVIDSEEVLPTDPVFEEGITASVLDVPPADETTVSESISPKASAQAPSTDTTRPPSSNSFIGVDEDDDDYSFLNL